MMMLLMIMIFSNEKRYRSLLMTNIIILSHEVTVLKIETVVRITIMVMTTIMTAIEKLYTYLYIHMFTHDLYIHTRIYTHI